MGGPQVTGGAPGAGATLSAARPLDIVVTLVSGNGLVARDANGSSDPYCCVAVMDGNKIPRHSLPPQSTPYDSNTLDPVWGHSMTFRGVHPTDIFEITVWDKDFVGKDEFMGSVKVPMQQLQLGAGRRSLKGDLPLTGDPPKPLPFMPAMPFIRGMGEVTGQITVVFKLE